MTKLEAWQMVGEAGYPPVTFGYSRRVIAGPRQWRDAFRTLRTRELLRLIDHIHKPNQLPPRPAHSATVSPAPASASRLEVGDDMAGTPKELGSVKEPSHQPHQSDPRTLPASATRGPSALHWRTVRQALQLFLGLGQHASLHWWRPSVLPEFEFRWDDPDFPFDRAAALTAFFADGSLAICLRSDIPLEDLHHAVLHELQHVVDAAEIRDGRMSKAEYEQRADDMVNTLSNLR